MKISLSLFNGQVPRTTPLKLGETYAQTAQDCVLLNGNIAPRTTELDEATTLVCSGGAIDAIHRWDVGGSNYWLRFSDPVSVIRSPIADDTYSRIYWSGDSRLSGDVLYSYTPAVYTGGTEYPENYYKLGIPAPLYAPTVAISGSPPSNDNSEARYYVYTLVGKMGEEGPPSPVSDLIEAANDGVTVNLSDLLVDASISSGREIEYIRIYRTLAGDTGADFYFVAQIAIASTTYSDTKDAAELGDALVTTSYTPPRDAMQGLILTAHGVAFGFVGKIVCPSELFLPYAWPREYELTCFNDVVALGFYDYHVIVGTKGRPVMITGTDPSSLSMQELPLAEACASARSMVSMGWCAIYASFRGLVLASGSDAVLVTEKLWTEAQWRALDPDSIHACDANGKYLFFYDNGTDSGGFIFDPRRPDDGVIAVSTWYKATYRDPSNGKLYLIDGDEKIWSWERGATLEAMTWRSKIFRLPRPAGMSACRVRAMSYDDLTITIYADGTEYHSQAVTSGAAFRLPRGGKFQEWEVEVTGTDEVATIVIAESMGELQQ